jgi:hypothetical protein
LPTRYQNASRNSIINLDNYLAPSFSKQKKDNDLKKKVKISTNEGKKEVAWRLNNKKLSFKLTEKPIKSPQPPVTLNNDINLKNSRFKREIVKEF